MCSVGVLRIVGDKERSNHDKHLSDGRFSTMVLRVGDGGTVNGPVVFFESGKSMYKSFIGNFW